MAIVINDPFARGGGAVAGQEFGNLISSGLQQLAQHKMSQLAQRNQTKAYENLGLSPQLASGLSRLSPDQQNVILKSIGKEQGFGLQQPFGQQFNEQQQFQPTQEQAAPLETSMQALGLMPQNPFDQLARQALGSQAPTQEQRGIEVLQQPKTQEQEMGEKFLQKAAPKEAQTIQQRREAQKQSLLQQKEIRKENAPIIKKVREEEKSAKDSLTRLQRMTNLVKKKGLIEPTLNSAIETIAHGIFGFGIDLSGLTNPDTQEFKKLSTDFIRDAKSIFGARITDADLNAFMKRIPSLMQSDEGKLRVINNLSAIEDGKIIRGKALRDIMKQYGNNPPENIDELIEQRVGKQLKDISQKVVSGEYGEKLPKEKSIVQNFVDIIKGKRSLLEGLHDTSSYFRKPTNPLF